MIKKMLCQPMRRLLIAVQTIGGFLLAMTLIACCRKDAYDESEPTLTPDGCEQCIGLQVTMEKQTYAQGEPITVTATTLVLGDVRVSVSRNRRSDVNYDLSVFDAQGIAVPRTDEGLAAVTVKPALVDVLISPGDPFQESYQLDRLFSLSDPGTYTLITKKVIRIWGTSGGEEIEGNSMVFTRLP